MLIDFCERNVLIVTNTWFKKPKRRLYTWKAPGDRRRHQLDYILVKHRFRNSVKDVKTLPGADIDSDPNLLVAKFQTRLKKIIRFQKRGPLCDLENLYTYRQSVQETLQEKLGAIGGESGNIEVQWNNIKECILNTIRELVGKVEKITRKPCVTQEMMSKMEERRKWKNVNNEEGRRKYRRLRNELKRATERAKKEYLEKIYDARCTNEIKSRIAMDKAAFSKKKKLFISKLDSNLRKKLVNCYNWSIALYGAETWTLRAVDQKHLESLEM
ncbi:hypothetical protein B7P43_G17331 [Cryptotermes secundus]|uniref:Uncharacterized protein n=1 Tax=Cryptotermes secundus TaxID=105785 RepID=A0A2J7QIE6_9NEOP|nr:hypothetical protein B7P43_G17331 [Cryptotermes secundus]